MSTSRSAPALSRTAIVSRLRAAGCVFAEDEAQLLLDSATAPGTLSAMVEQRVAGLPLEHIVGWVDFCGLRLAVDPGVFVPRRRTELLVDRAAALAAPGATIVDLACGSGAVGRAVAARVDGVSLYAADIEPAAVRCARRNLAPLGGRVYAGDLYDPLPVELRGRVDVLVANVPYVPTEAVDLLPPEARIHEPLVALDGGADGLDVLRRVAAEAGDWLAPGGHLLLETSAGQVDAALAALAGVRAHAVVGHRRGVARDGGHRPLLTASVPLANPVPTDRTVPSAATSRAAIPSPASHGAASAPCTSAATLNALAVTGSAAATVTSCHAGVGGRPVRGSTMGRAGRVAAGSAGAGERATGQLDRRPADRHPPAVRRRGAGGRDAAAEGDQRAGAGPLGEQVRAPPGRVCPRGRSQVEQHGRRYAQPAVAQRDPAPSVRLAARGQRRAADRQPRVAPGSAHP